MPIIQSAIKRVKQNKVRRERRQPVKSLMKTMIRKIKDFIDAKDVEGAKKTIPGAYKAIDMAAKRNIIHKNTAARKKSQLMKWIAGMEK